MSAVMDIRLTAPPTSRAQATTVVPTGLVQTWASKFLRTAGAAAIAAGAAAAISARRAFQNRLRASFGAIEIGPAGP
jgi:hypothetical protein